MCYTCGDMGHDFVKECCGALVRVADLRRTADGADCITEKEEREDHRTGHVCEGSSTEG
jgi:hypothetical protein